MEYTLTANNIEKSYNSTLIFSDFTFTFKTGNIYLFKGSSGCGKSTMLDILSTYIKPDKGTVYLNDETKVCNNVAYFTLENNVFIELSVIENLKIISNDLTKICKVLEDVKLSNKKGELAKNLSKGEQARLAISRMLLEDRKIILFDEPFSNLDKDNALNILKIFNKIKDEHIIIISSNDNLDSDKYCDYVFTYDNYSFKLISENENTIKVSYENHQKSSQISNVFFLKSFLKKIILKTLKHKLFIIPILIFLHIVCFFSLMFINTSGNDYVYNNMRKSNINGIDVVENYSDSVNGGVGCLLTINGQNLFAVCNKLNAFKSSSFDIELQSDYDIALPSNISSKLNLKIDSKLKINNCKNEAIVKNIYQYDESITNALTFINKFNKNNVSNILEHNYPILISNTIFNEILNDSTPIYFYGFDLLFKNNKNTFYLPSFLSEISDNTYNFWKNKNTSNIIINIIFYISLSLLIFIYLLLIISICLAFKNENILFKYIDCNYKRSGFYSSVDSIISLFSSFIIATIIYTSISSIFNNSICKFFIIDNLISFSDQLLFSILITLFIDFLLIIFTFISIYISNRFIFLKYIHRK